jgi:hypothetical protein
VDLGVATVDLLKIDIEGAEDDALRRSGRLEDIHAIIGEFHREFTDDDGWDEFRRLLSSYDVTTLSNSRHVTFTAVRRT